MKDPYRNTPPSKPQTRTPVPHTKIIFLALLTFVAMCFSLHPVGGTVSLWVVTLLTVIATYVVILDPGAAKMTPEERAEYDLLLSRGATKASVCVMISSVITAFVWL